MQIQQSNVKVRPTICIITTIINRFCLSLIRSTTNYKIPLKLIATRSGLTRYHKSLSEDDFDLDDNFVPIKSIDETFYKRSVDYQSRSKEGSSYLISIPFDSINSFIGDTFITVSKSLFISSKNGKIFDSPLATFAAKINYISFAEMFMNHIINCPATSMNANSDNSGCKVDCSSESIDCLLVDNNGYIIVHDRDFEANNQSNGRVRYAGMFLGQFDHNLFEDLANNNVFSKIILYDYQAICIAEGEKRSSAANHLNPFTLIINWLITFFTAFNQLLVKLYFACDTLQSISDAVYFNPSDYDYEYMVKQANLEYSNTTSGNLVAPTRTFFYPCDKRLTLYEGQNFKNFDEPIERSYSVNENGLTCTQ